MEKPLPIPTQTSKPFWDGLAAHKVRIQQCRVCQAWVFYPRVACPRCLAPDLDWRDVSGAGTLYTYAIARKPTHPLFADDVPQFLAVVQLDEGPRLTSTLVNVRESDVRIGMRLEPFFDDVSGRGVTMLRYQPARKGTSVSAKSSVLTEEAKAYVGREGEAVTGYPVTEHEIRRFCYAVDDSNPRYVDPQYAAGTRAKGIVAPPLFVSVPFSRLDVPLSQLRSDGVPSELEGGIMPPLGDARLMWGGLEMEFFAEVRPGDVLTLKSKVVDIHEREGKSGAMAFIVTETTYTNQRGERVAVERFTTIAR